MVETYWNREWAISFKTSGAEFDKTINMNSDDLAAFRVIGNCDRGKLYLRISQGETTKTLDLSDSFNEIVDMSAFSVGKVKLTIYNEGAKGASVVVRWRN